ncbi:MAG: hypothetical protein KAS18_08855 [Calditrichia bacterium]|nr:hypothetical protein [Calditrichia bacterium]
MSNKREIGFWVLMIPGLLILFMLIFGQMISFIDYDFTVSLGLQESVNVISEFGVASNKAFGVGDTLIYLPLLILGLIGLWQKEGWGLIAMVGALAITAYWPIVNLFFLYFAKDLPGFNFTDFVSYTIVLSLISIYGLWGMWYIYRNGITLSIEK